MGGSVAALVLGIMSLGASFFTVGAAITAIVGIGMGIWGLYSNKRGLAFTGILLCCLALAVSGFNGAVQVYTQIYGRSPFAAPLEGEEEEDPFAADQVF